MSFEIIRAAVAAAALALSGNGATAALQPEAADALLWHQYGAPTNWMPSQRFTGQGYEQYDTRGADDFVVPAGETWILKRIKVHGHQDLGSDPPLGANLYFYADSGGLPGEIVRIDEWQAAKGDGAGEYSVKLINPLRLRSGKYWLSVQMVRSPSQSIWSWSMVDAQSGDAAVWQNPLDGYVTGCVAYRRVADCYGDMGGSKDFRFQLLGKRKTRTSP
jgi:hypothetical protein